MKNLIIFILGATTGSVVTWKLLEEKYKKIADEEIESVIEKFKNDNETNNIITEHQVEVSEYDDNKNEYVGKITDLGYIKVEDGDDNIAPYTIDPDEYGACINYDAKEWTLYSDGILTDENDDLVYEPELIIGDALEHFNGEDCVYVRNDNTECDYEILKVKETYDEIFKGDK